MSPQGKVLLQLINQYNIATVAEIGVWKGKTARFILRSFPYSLRTYFGIDTWDLLGEEHGHMGKLVKDDWDKLYKRAAEDMLWFDKFRAIRLSSEKAATLFKDESLDLVFIDASHYYKDVINDIKIWLPKVKKGGLLTGHDYGSWRHRDVKKAVDDTFGIDNIITYGKPSLVWQYQKI